MSIDKIYIINLVHCTDRKARIENQLKLANVTNYEIFNGIVPNIDMLNTFPNFCKTSPEHERLNMLGCLLSHISIMKLAINNNYDNIIVLEDDCQILDNNFLNKAEIGLKSLSQNYDILYLGANHKHNALKKINDNLYQTRGANGTFAYCISKSFMEELVKPYNYKFPIDIHWRKFNKMRDSKFYCLIPHAINIYDCVSTISECQTNYAKTILNSQNILTQWFN
jgi:GR25 family glycosyltransferase involved in LPS biosynthesis